MLRALQVVLRLRLNLLKDSVSFKCFGRWFHAIISIYSKGVSRVLNIDSVEQLRKEIDGDPIIKGSMTDVGALLAGGYVWSIFDASLVRSAYSEPHRRLRVARRGYNK